MSEPTPTDRFPYLENFADRYSEGESWVAVNDWMEENEDDWDLGILWTIKFVYPNSTNATIPYIHRKHCAAFFEQESFDDYLAQLREDERQALLSGAHSVTRVIESGPDRTVIEELRAL